MNHLTLVKLVQWVLTETLFTCHVERATDLLDIIHTMYVSQLVEPRAVDYSTSYPYMIFLVGMNICV